MKIEFTTTLVEDLRHLEEENPQLWMLKLKIKFREPTNMNPKVLGKPKQAKSNSSRQQEMKTG